MFWQCYASDQSHGRSKAYTGNTRFEECILDGKPVHHKAACTQTHLHRRFRITKPPDIFVWGERNSHEHREEHVKIHTNNDSSSALSLKDPGAVKRQCDLLYRHFIHPPPFLCHEGHNNGHQSKIIMRAIYAVCLLQTCVISHCNWLLSL